MSTLQRHLRILVVDDNADQANSLSMLLQHYGYDSQACIHAQKCLASVGSWRPDVVLLDLGMPGITGFDIAQEIKACPELQNIRLVAVTGHGEPLDRLQTKMCGFDEHLLKPIDFGDLETILESIQDRKDQ
jgi:CheY-like chemotaxis protein